MGPALCVAPGCLCETSGFGTAALCDQSLGCKDVIPLHENARLFTGGERPGSLGSICLPCNPGPKPQVCRRRNREPENF